MRTLARTLPVLLFLSILFTHSSHASDGNRAFGLFYTQSEAGYLTSDEIQWLRDTGITWLMVESMLPDSTRDTIRDAGLSLYVMVPEYFPIPLRLAAATSDYNERADAFLRHYHLDPAVKGFGLFAYGNWTRPPLADHLRRLVEPHISGHTLFTLDPRSFSGEDLYPFDGTVMYTRNAGMLSHQLAQNPDLAGILYAPDTRNFSVRDFQNVMHLLDSQNNLPVFFNRNWFIWNSIRSNTQELSLPQIVDFYYHKPDARVANPAPQNRENKINISILLLLVLWGAFASIHRFNPVYRKSIERFFINYVFFVNDILMRRIRLTGESVIAFFLSAYLSGVIGYAVAELYLDSISREALVYYIRFIPDSWSHPIIYFFVFFILSAIVNSILILWLRLANRQHAQTYQTAIFILWPQHLNLIFVSIGVILLRSFPSEYIAVTMIVLYWVILLFSFFAAAYNMRRIHPTSPVYIILTYVLYIMVLTFVLSWMVYGVNFISIWNLASSLASF